MKDNAVIVGIAMGALVLIGAIEAFKPVKPPPIVEEEPGRILAPPVAGFLYVYDDSTWTWVRVRVGTSKAWLERGGGLVVCSEQLPNTPSSTCRVLDDREREALLQEAQ